MSLTHHLPGFRLPVRDPYGYDCLNNYALQGHIIFRKLSNCRKITSCRRNCIFSFWEKGGSASRRKNQGWCLDCLAITATESGRVWSKQTAFSVSEPGSSRQRRRKETQVIACITCYASEMKPAVSLAVATTAEVTALRSTLDRGLRAVLLRPKLFGRVRVCSNVCLPKQTKRHF